MYYPGKVSDILPWTLICVQQQSKTCEAELTVGFWTYLRVQSAWPLAARFSYVGYHSWVGMGFLGCLQYH